MRPEIVPATIRDVTWIAANLREQDRAEIAEVYPGSLTALAIGLVLGSTAAWVARLGSDPVGALGIVDIHPGIGSGWAFGTNRFRRVVPELTRFCAASTRTCRLQRFMSRAANTSGPNL